MKQTVLNILTAMIASALTVLSVSAQTGLDARQRAIVPIAAFTANGNLPALRSSLVRGLDEGLSINEINEVLVQVYAYCGFPKSLNALNTFMDVTEERRMAGKNDKVGTSPSPIPSGIDMSERGEEIRTELVGRPVTGKVYQFCPVIDEYLRAHLFGDIFFA